VAATGYWANIVDPPYTSFGISTNDPALLKQTNKQFSHSSVDVAEHNLLVSACVRGLCQQRVRDTSVVCKGYQRCV
jgi:hypothetical protein